MTKEFKYETTVPKTSFYQLDKLIFGFGKTGKTTLASHMCSEDGKKKPLFIMSESGHGSLELYSRRVYNFADFERVVTDLYEHKAAVQKQFSCIVIDLISDICNMAEDDILKEYKIKSLADLEWGSGFKQHFDRVKSRIEPLFGLLPLVFITHSEEKEWNLNGENIKSQTPVMPKKIRDWIHGKVDVCGFIIPAGTKGGIPSITFRASTMAAGAGGRFSFLADKDFDLDYKDTAKSYKDIANYFADKSDPKQKEKK